MLARRVLRIAQFRLAHGEVFAAFSHLLISSLHLYRHLGASEVFIDLELMASRLNLVIAHFLPHLLLALFALVLERVFDDEVQLRAAVFLLANLFDFV